MQIPTTPAFDAAVATGDWVPAPGDYDGDAVTDLAVYAPATGKWVIQRSHDDGLTQVTLGGVGFRPAPADFDGDGKTVPAAYRRLTGLWRYLASSTGNKVRLPELGQSGEIPVVGMRHE